VEDGMALRRIIAHFMHEPERDAALELCQNTEVQGHLVVGDIEEDEIPRLRQAGVFVQLAEPLAEAPPSLLPPPTVLGARPTDEDARAVPDLGPPADVDVYVLRLDGPLLDGWREQLEALSVELLEHLQGGRFSARIPIASVPAVDQLRFVLDLRRYASADTAAPPVLSARVGARGEPETFELMVHRQADLGQVRAWMEERRLEVAGASRRTIRFRAAPGAPELAELARLPEVAVLDEFVPPTFSNDHARRLLGLDPASVGASPAISLTGSGQTVAVVDSGLDTGHPDFAGRFTAVAYGRPGDPSDPHGHGTHVAGSVLGDGAASNGRVRGIAPAARLFFQSILDAGGGLALGEDVGDLFEESYQAGARISNNSWGAAASSAYRINSMQVDEFVAGRPDMLVVIAAGNKGRAANPRYTQRGWVDLFSLDAPATAKNALTVGACRSDRVREPAQTWSQVSSAYPSPIGDAPVSGDAEAMAAFSSRGPCHEQIRIKPDVVAPGTMILSTRSADAPERHFSGDDPDNRRYAFMSGTSMATPLASGCAALVRQHYLEQRGHTPSAALLKATIVNGARWLTGTDAIADHPREPNYHQGFGRIYLPWTIPNTATPAMALEFDDRWQDAGAGLLRSGDADQFVFQAGDDCWLRLCLVWTDPPGRGVQNNLNLFLEHRDSGRKWSGNEHRRTEFPSPDPGNNVQVIRIDAPASGSWWIQVAATNVLKAPQHYALVVAGAVRSPLTRI
jgi:serine protease AprX